MTKQPFAFVRDGKFAYAELQPFISIHGLNHLNTVALGADEQKAVDALNAAVTLLVVKHTFSTSLSNDAPSDTLKKVHSWEDSGWKGDYYNSQKECYTVVDLGSWYKTFNSDLAIEGITSHSSTWGWQALQNLQPHSTALRKLAKKHNVTIEVKLIDRILKHQEALRTDDMTLRIPDNVSDFGRAEGFAVFLGTGYADFQWSANTIEKAKLFGSENLAREAMRNNGRIDAVVVKVETAIKEICDSTSVSALHDALAALQKERLENALQNAELETLRAYVARMESQTTTEVKRKM